MDNGEQMTCETVAAEAEEERKETDTEPDIGKFRSVEALLSAYRSLEAEFTRRSQRLKELEEKQGANIPGEPLPSSGEEQLIEAALSNERVKNAVVGEYLKDIAVRKSAPMLAGGVACAAPSDAPKSVKEAGKLAKQFLDI